MPSSPNNDSTISASGEWVDAAFYRKALGQAGNRWKIFWLWVIPPKGHRIVPTRSGYILMLVALGIGSAAYNTSSNMLFIALSLLLSSLILSGLLSTLNFKGIGWRLRLPQCFRVDDESTVWIDVKNQKSFFPTYNIKFNTEIKNEAIVERIHLEQRLDPSTEQSLQWRFVPGKRGKHVISISGLQSQFPFGFLQKTLGGGVKREITVLPKRIDYDFKSPSGFRSHHQGETTTRQDGNAELINIRNYQQGDPQRLVHWKATARIKQLMVKQMSEDNHDGYTLFVETPASIWLNGEQFEHLCCFASSLAEDLFRAGQLARAAINDEPIMPIKRFHDLSLFLERMATLMPVEYYKSNNEKILKNTIITFKPGNLNRVNAYVGGNLTGTT